MNKDEEVDADDLFSETDRTRHKIRRDFEKFRRRLQEMVQLPQATKKYRPLHLTFLSKLLYLPMKTTSYMSSDVFIKGNLRKYVMYGELLWILLYVCM